MKYEPGHIDSGSEPWGVDTFSGLRLVPEALSPEQLYQTSAETRTISVRGHDVRYTFEMPENQDNPNTAVIVPGFCGLEVAYGELRHMIAGSGRPSITMQQPRSTFRDTLNDLHHHRPIAELQSESLAAVLDDAHTTYGMESCVLVCHSMGGKTASDMLGASGDETQAPYQVINATFMATAGSDGSNLFTLATRAPRYFGQEVRDELNEFSRIYGHHPITSFRQAKKYFGNLAEIAAEGIDAANADLIPSLDSIRAARVGTAALLLTEDSLFSSDAARVRLQGHVDYTLDLKASHNAPMTQPEKVCAALQAIWWQLEC